MILTSTDAAAAVPFTPNWLADRDNPPVFLIRAGSVMERELMEAELAGELGAGTVWPWELHGALVAGFEALGGEDAEQLVALAQVDLAGEDMAAEERQMLEAAKGVMRQHWPEYGALVAQNERRNSVLPVAAFRRFCTGWHNVTDHRQLHKGKPVTFLRGADRCVAERALQGVDPLQLRAAGLRAFALQYGAGMEKNSDAPSSSGDDPMTSSSDADSAEDGSSPESATSTTLN